MLLGKVHLYFPQTYIKSPSFKGKVLTRYKSVIAFLLELKLKMISEDPNLKCNCNFDNFNPNWTVRPNPEGRIIRQPEGRIFNHKAEMIINGKAESDRKAE